ncbi:MAG TPA: J domain-containing protein [Acidimicrobiia bacterium]|nr:J domain-containing protein [Acidimicrobiia bacterium]
MADYYEVLGVAPDASQEEIKKAFRRLARETHPDANNGDRDREERFRLIAEAYEVLSDPQRRAAYDRGDRIDLNDLFSSFAGVDDLLSRFFGGGFGPFGAAPRGPAPGRDVAVAVSVSLAEAAQGVERTVTYRVPAACPTCGGSGSAPGAELPVCDRCGGQGSVRVTRQTLLGAAMTVARCDRCQGRGRVVVEPCPECKGGGAVTRDLEVEVEIPAGIEDGSRIRLTGRGAVGEAGAPAGDLYVEVTVEPDPRFRRHGPDLVHRVEIGMAEAALGATRSIPTVDADPVDIDIPAGTQPGTVFKLSKQGMPRLHRRGRGDLLVEVAVKVPDRLSKEAEEALRAYGEAMEEAPAEGKKRRRS